MIKVQKQPIKQVQNINVSSVIGPATEQELAKYEKDKLASIEERAQQNKLEVIRINGVRVPIDRDTKTADIKVGELAFKNQVTSSDLDANELFLIKCSLD